MPDPIQPKRRGNPAMRAGGPSLNPAGRPKVGESLAGAMRARFPPERIVELAEKLATGAESEQVRLAALQMIAERAHGKVVTTLDVHATTLTSAPTLDLTSMPLDDQRRLLEAIRAARLGAGDVDGGA